MVLLPLAESLLRSLFGIGMPAAAPFVQHLTLWVGFLGAALAAREGKLLALATGDFLPGLAASRRHQRSRGVGAGVSAMLARASFDLMLIERAAGTRIAGVFPVWVTQAVLPARSP